MLLSTRPLFPYAASSSLTVDAVSPCSDECIVCCFIQDENECRILQDTLCQDDLTHNCICSGGNKGMWWLPKELLLTVLW